MPKNAIFALFRQLYIYMQSSDSVLLWRNIALN